MSYRICFGALALAGALNAATASEGKTPVVVELFTSEGCSSCPSADALLSRLDKTQPVAGAQIIALEEHVDYWNQLGWADPFSSPQFSRRQNEYSEAFRIDNVYTPQMVVNGKSQFTGSNGKLSSREIAAAAESSPAWLLHLERANDRLSITLQRNGDAKTEAADIVLAITESQLSSNVRRGENSGRLLQHAPVVRSLGIIGSIRKSQTGELELTSALNLGKGWNRENLRAVVFVQNRASGRIVGAAAIDAR